MVDENGYQTDESPYADEGPPPPPPPPPSEEWSGELSSEERQWAMFAHLSAILLGFIGPLVIWLVKKDESEYISEHAKEALNFQISVFIYIIGCMFAMIILIGFLLLPAVGIFALVVEIIAGIRASEGQMYRYPLCIRFIK